MNLRVIYDFLGRIALATATVMAVPFLLSISFQDTSRFPLFVSVVVCVSVGIMFLAHGRVRVEQLTMREGVAITGLGWLLVTTLGMLPYLIGGYIGILDGIFESISGFTGTGATVIDHLESLPRGILFWRSMTQWFGGLGIIVIFIALLPQTGQSTVYMYNAETTGPTQDRMVPRLKDTTKVLFQMYMFFTGFAMLVYWFCGMDWITALDHAFATIGAGGFSTYDANAMHFNSPVLEGWITFFMILIGGNFGLYYRVYRKGMGVLWRDTEFKAYIGMLLAATLLIGGNLLLSGARDAFSVFRYTTFQVASLSTTGFVSTDFDQWPAFSKGILLLLMLTGGCAGSTAGGMKVTRMVMLCKAAWAIVRQKIHPRAVMTVSMNGKNISEPILARVGQFFFLYILFIALWALLLTADGIQFFDAIGLSVTTMGSVGPAFGIAGATCTYAGLSDFAKSVLCVSMLLGRLEMFTILVMLRPSFWRTDSRW